VPESFKVLLKEMQSLALDIQVMSEEGGSLEVAEEEDDLLRAAEELGIDLSARYRTGAREEADAEGTLVPTHTGSELDEEGDEDEDEADEFEGAPDIEGFEIEMESDLSDIQLTPFADDSE